MFSSVMMELYIFKMQLTDKQLTIWKEQGSYLSAPPQLCQQALTFYQSYKQCQHWAHDKTQLVIKVAYFLAEKSQVLFDKEGRRLKSIAISANSVLRDHPMHQEFLYHLLQMFRSITIPPESTHLQEEISAFSKQFSSSITFLNKFRSTLKKIKVNRKIQDPQEYIEQATRLLWLLFIDCRSEIQIQTDLIENTCLLGCILTYYIMEKYQEEGIFSIYFEHENEGCTLPNEIEELASFSMSYLHIKDYQIYQLTYNKMRKYLQGLRKTIDMKRVFSHQNVAKNIYLVQRGYQKKCCDGRLDQSIFLKQNVKSNHGVKLTPFARKAPLAPKNNSGLSHKILTFQNIEETSEAKGEMKKDEKGNLKLFSKLKLQPTPKTNLIRATPMSEAMQNYNWLFDKSGHFPLSQQEIEIIDETFQASIFSEHRYESKKDHCQLAGGLWKQTLQKLPEASPKALLLISVYAVCHVLNATTHDISIPMGFLELGQYQIWEGLDQIINSFDKNMPLALKLTLLNLETSFVSSRLWTSYSNIEFFLGDAEHKSRLVRRMLHQGAYTLHFLTRKLSLEEQFSEISYQIFQEALMKEGELIYQKMLEHLIVCSLYAATKVRECSIRFNQVLAALREVLGMSSCQFDQLVQIAVGEDKKQNIIDYYNDMFVPSIKVFLRELRHSNCSETSPGPLGSKFKEVVARDNCGLVSPQLTSYFAYCESPMLKSRGSGVLNTITNMTTNTIKREKTYGLSDIQAKFGKINSNGLKETARKSKN